MTKQYLARFILRKKKWRMDTRHKHFEVRNWILKSHFSFWEAMDSIEVREKLNTRSQTDNSLFTPTIATHSLEETVKMNK